MNELLRNLQVGASESAKLMYNTYGAVFFHIAAIFGFIMCSVLAPHTSIVNKMFILVVCFVVGQMAVSFAKKCVKEDEE